MNVIYMIKQGYSLMILNYSAAKTGGKGIIKVLPELCKNDVTRTFCLQYMYFKNNKKKY